MWIFNDIPDSKKLERVYFHDNVFPQSELNAWGKFTNLQKLSISNNNFTGSLEPLKNLTKLKYLNIKNTNIHSGLEYLPDNLGFFEPCLCFLEEIKCKEIQRKMTPFGDNYEEWKKSNPDLIAQAQEIIELEKSVNNLDSALSNVIEHENNRTTLVALDIFRFETQSQILEMKIELKTGK